MYLTLNAIFFQTINENDYVLHLIRTPLHETQTKDSAPVKVGSLSKMSDLQESWVAEHAKCVSYILLILFLSSYSCYYSKV